MLVIGSSIFIPGPPWLELQITRWGLVVRDREGRRLGMIRAVEA